MDWLLLFDIIYIAPSIYYFRHFYSILTYCTYPKFRFYINEKWQVNFVSDYKIIVDVYFLVVFSVVNLSKMKTSSKSNKCRSRQKSKSVKRVEIVTSNPYFNFLRCLRARHPNWTCKKLAMEGATLWCSLSIAQKTKFDGDGSEIKKSYQFKRQTRSKSRERRMCSCCGKSLENKDEAHRSTSKDTVKSASKSRSSSGDKRRRNWMLSILITKIYAMAFIKTLNDLKVNSSSIWAG